MSVTNTSLLQHKRADEVTFDRRAVPYQSVRDVLEGLAALLLLVASSPLLLLIAVVVKLTSPGPIIYSQIRVGLDGAIFTIYKFRSMTAGCEAGTGACWSTPGDPRVTPVGRVLRATHLDELPQLWNILRGDMSLIGPRPERPEFVAKLEQALPGYSRRLTVKPGLTGLAQIQLPPDTDIAGVAKKLAHDLYYVEHRSLTLDVRILLGTVTHVLGISARGTSLLCQLPTIGEPEPFLEPSLSAPQADAIATAAG